MFRFGDRGARMNWVHVRNLVQAHVLAAEALTAAKGYVAVSPLWCSHLPGGSQAPSPGDSWLTYSIPPPSNRAVGRTGSPRSWAARRGFTEQG